VTTSTPKQTVNPAQPAALRRDLARIEDALRRAGALLVEYARRDLDVEHKSPGHPVTEADRAADDLLRGLLPEDGDGWLSEETVDDRARLEQRRVWIVDPLDGTKEFIAGIPEWSVSVALAEGGRPVAGGVYNPLAEHLVLGAVGLGVTLNGEAATMTDPADLAGGRVLASRSEIKRGEWRRFEAAGLEVVPTGSVAYKLALVAAGLADATWTLCPKHEWDVAAGAAMVAAGGGEVLLPDGSTPAFNQPRPLFPGFLAAGARLAGRLPRLVAEDGPDE
jgi:myo-inositol-1(or 4)-monophosphatase